MANRRQSALGVGWSSAASNPIMQEVLPSAPPTWAVRMVAEHVSNRLRIPRLRFSLRSLLVVLTIFGMWLGWNANVVRKRVAMRREIRELGGWIQLRGRTEGPLGVDESGNQVIGGLYDLIMPDDAIPLVRQCLGDEAVEVIELPNDRHIERVRHTFPEAFVVDDAARWTVTGEVPNLRSPRADQDGGP